VGRSYSLPNPNGCAACDIDSDMHAQRWDPELRWHVWVAPRNEVRLARMKALRENRLK
jgi:hypothetical protein